MQQSLFNVPRNRVEDSLAKRAIKNDFVVGVVSVIYLPFIGTSQNSFKVLDFRGTIE